ncbi:MAG TPA: hypothetical protein PLH46_05045 [Caldisericia bacterium]|nr:hypothetical protein [Caldisericia bacterium]
MAAKNEELNDLFNSNLDSTMDFLNDKKTVSNDGLYRVDLSLAKDKKKGYRSVIRFLPNLTKEGTLGQSAIEKISHFVKIKEPKELGGYYDSMKNFPGEKCGLTDLYYTLMNSKNAILQEKAKLLNYSKKYYSYVLVLEDENQPDLVGKILIMQYGKTIKDKILSEKNGEVNSPCNVFDLAKGKDFVLLVKEIQTGDETYPDYKASAFRQDTTSLPLYLKDKAVFKNIPLTSDGTVDPKVQSKVKEFLLDREHDLEEFAPKRLDEAQQAKVSEITDLLTGKSQSNFNKTTPNASSDDFDFESDLDVVFDKKATKKEETMSEEDFFDFD